MMLEFKGKNNTAKVFTDNIDQETISQVITLLNQPYIGENKIRIMPDCHAGAVLNLIEDLLEENDITIPDEDREGDEGEARLYGGTYYELEEKIVDIMQDI